MPGRVGHNEKGYFESLSLVRLNSLALELGGSHWQALAGPPPEWFASHDAAALRGNLQQILSSKFGKSDFWAVKDPRMSRLLPLWLPCVASSDPRVVIAYRHPSEVAASLAARDGFSAEKSSWLWLDHLLASEFDSRNQQRAFIDYSSLLRDPVATLDELENTLSLSWPQREGAEGRLAEFVDRGLKHHRPAEESSGGDFERLAIELYTELAAGRANSEGLWESIASRFEAVRSQHDLLLAAHVNQSTTDLRHDVRNTESILRERGEGLQRLVERADALQRQIRASEEQIARQSRISEEVRDRIERLEADLRARTEEFHGELGVARAEAQAHRMVGEHARNLAEMLWTSKPWKAYLKLGSLKKRFFGGVPAPTPALVQAAVPGAEDGEVTPSESRPVAKEIRLPKTTQPVVSIVVPVYNQVAFTWQCLDSIATTPTSVEYEVIVVDDLSTDETVERLAEVENLRLVTKEENSGFIGSCNRGAEEARGQYVLFLNNDTTVTPGWLDALVGTFEDFADVGMVGGKLVFPDGKLQEAGGIVWRDGSAWNFGRGQHPDAPEFSYAREADYCSGACLMISRDLFMELDMFDRHYSPAYYEDTDLAFRVRAAGKKVIYQPHCKIYHYEGASCGTDLTSGIKQYQVENGKKFFERWENTLATHRANGVQPEREKERAKEFRCLIVDHRMPTPDQDSGSVRMSGVIEILRQEGWKVSFLPDNLDPAQPYTQRLQAQGVEVVHGPFIHSVKQHLQEAGSLYDVVLLSRVHVAASHIDDVRRFCPQAMILFDTVDLHFVREMRRAELEGDAGLKRRAEKTRELELSVAKRATKTVVVSNVEGDVLKRHAPELEVALISNIYDVVPPERPFADRSGAFFIGGFEHNPNVDAAVWLVREILPHVLRELPDFHLYILGSKPTAEVMDLASPEVTVTGFVPEVDPYLERCRLSLAPLRFGAGVKGKLTQSLAHGLPSVATGLACEGMGLQHEVDVLVGDTAEEFARQVVRGHEDEALWHRLSAGGLRNTEENASMAVARRHLLEAIDAVPVSA